MSDAFFSFLLSQTDVKGSHTPHSVKDLLSRGERLCWFPFVYFCSPHWVGDVKRGFNQSIIGLSSVVVLDLWKRSCRSSRDRPCREVSPMERKMSHFGLVGSFLLRKTRDFCILPQPLSLYVAEDDEYERLTLF
jgi:hypothetical protein